MSSGAGGGPGGGVGLSSGGAFGGAFILVPNFPTGAIYGMLLARNLTRGFFSAGLALRTVPGVPWCGSGVNFSISTLSRGRSMLPHPTSCASHGGHDQVLTAFSCATSSLR